LQTEDLKEIKIEEKKIEEAFQRWTSLPKQISSRQDLGRDLEIMHYLILQFILNKQIQMVGKMKL
jgi:hypothetical protein